MFYLNWIFYSAHEQVEVLLLWKWLLHKYFVVSRFNSKLAISRMMTTLWTPYLKRQPKTSGHFLFQMHCVLYEYKVCAQLFVTKKTRKCYSKVVHLPLKNLHFCNFYIVFINFSLKQTRKQFRPDHHKTFMLIWVFLAKGVQNLHKVQSEQHARKRVRQNTIINNVSHLHKYS